MSTGIDVALCKGFHKLTAYDMAAKCRAMLEARPTREFAALEPGKTYCYKPPYGNRFELLTIGEVTPKRTQAVASVDGGAPRRIYKGSYTGTFAELDADLVALARITHEMVVKAAVDAGLDVPPIVRREYPGLFVEIPDRFANGRFSAVERVKQALLPAPFQREPVSVADVDKFIEHAHYLIATARCERTRRAALNPEMGQDYDRMYNDHMGDTRSTLAAVARASATAPCSSSRRATLPGSASRARPNSGDTLPRGIGCSSALFPRGTNTSYGRENGQS